MVKFPVAQTWPSQPGISLKRLCGDFGARTYDCELLCTVKVAPTAISVSELSIRRHNAGNSSLEALSETQPYSRHYNYNSSSIFQPSTHR
ncbi:hypothetical protein Y032_0136g1986 [Ancylostoma ceylanicum]|uniref:Uncharacterized protein n=1 Tax=Ancylostoma ceylanicum TaxID=53326 RepID=A0A016T4H9_9BILA|nr:hypothetical protein Y032_0136g1986 [Ancylostoma ceylanicum]